jgi:hypothetical protein
MFANITYIVSFLFPEALRNLHSSNHIPQIVLWSVLQRFHKVSTWNMSTCVWFIYMTINFPASGSLLISLWGRFAEASACGAAYLGVRIRHLKDKNASWAADRLARLPNANSGHLYVLQNLHQLPLTPYRRTEWRKVDLLYLLAYCNKRTQMFLCIASCNTRSFVFNKKWHW